MILHVISGLGVGGAEAMLVSVARGLQARGIPQRVVSLRGEGAHGDALRAAGVPLTALTLDGVAQLPAAALSLRQLVARERPAVIQGWMYHGNVMAALANRLARGRASRRLAWGIRASDMDATRYAGINRVSAWMSGWPDVIVANSEAGAATHRALGYRARAWRIIRNGVDGETFRPDPLERASLRRELGLTPGAVVAIHVARVDPMKDHAGFLAGLARVPDVTGLLVGLGTDALPLPPNAQALGLRRDVARLYRAADLVVSSSAFGEGFSNVLAEGMSSGLIPVATDVGDARLIVGDAGACVPPRDAEALMHALAREARRPVSERTARGAAARAQVLAAFGVERMIDAHASLYTELAGGSGGR